MSTSTGDAPSVTRSTKVIVVADVVESVRLMEQDEQEFIRRWQRFVAFVQQRLPLDSGRLHKSLGDGLMLEFSDPDGCIRAALGMLAWFADANQGLPPEDQVQLRIGAHVAEFVADEYDIYGTDVNLAVRIASLAGPGEIVISDALRKHLRPEAQAQLEDLGTGHLKHVKDPVHAFRIGHAGRAPVMPVRRLASHTLRPTLAVLPFGLRGGPDRQPAGEALADDIVAALAGSDQLQVVSRLSTAHFADGHPRLDEVRRLVGAHYVLTGRARRHAGELSLFIELADVNTAHVAWAQSFHGSGRESDLIGGRLMREIVSAVHSAVIAHEVERARGEVFPALDGFTLLLAAIGLMHWLSDADLERSRAMLEHLVERGRGHSAPHAWLAHLHVLRLQQGHAASAAADAEAALDQAAAAVRCDPGSALALAMQAQACAHAARDLQRAEEFCARALVARPDDSLALLLQAELRALEGDGDAARDAARRAGENVLLAPLRPLYDSIAALAALVAGDSTAASTLARLALQRVPSHLPALVTLAVAQVLAGDLPSAQGTVQRLLQRQPGFGLGQFVSASPAHPEVTRRFAEALRQAGLPAG